LLFSPDVTDAARPSLYYAGGGVDILLAFELRESLQNTVIGAALLMLRDY